MIETTKEYYMPAEESQFTLKPCPFCGSTQAVYVYYTSEAGDRLKVECLHCGGSMAPHYATVKHDVQVAWNNRQPATIAGYDTQELINTVKLLQEREITPEDLSAILRDYGHAYEMAKQATERALNTALEQMRLKYQKEELTP